jgi:hypothetical protein
VAERRMVSKVISISEKVNSLSLFGRLLYTWMIPHTDDFGRLPGSPAKVRALVVPMGDETTKDVEAALFDMVSKDLIQWYEVSGEKYIQITNFDDHQSGLHKRTKSKFPDPSEQAEVKTQENQGFSSSEQNSPETSGKFPGIPPELELELELNRTKKNTATTHAYESSNSEIQDSEMFSIQEIHAQVFGKLVMNGLMGPYVKELLENGCSEDFVKEVMLETGESATTPSLRYMQSTAERWMREGISTREQARESKRVKFPNQSNRASPIGNVVPMNKEFILDENDELTKLMRKASEQYAGSS